MSDIISPEYFVTVYLVFVSALILLWGININKSNLLMPDSNHARYKCVIFIAVLLIVYLGTRSTTSIEMADTIVYVAKYRQIKSGLLPPDYMLYKNGHINWNGELVFTLIRRVMALNQLNVSLWLTVLAILYIMPYVKGIHIMFRGQEYVAFLFLISSFGFLNFGYNGLRNGVACSLGFLALAIVLTGKKYRLLWGALLCILAYWFHHSIMIFVTSMLLALYLIRKTSWALAIWFVTIIISLLLGSQLAEFATTYLDDQRAELYLSAGNNMREMEKHFSHVGFRWDFLAFSAIPIIMGWYVLIKRKIKDNYYQILVNTYILANAIWIIFMYAKFTNRFAQLSWFIYPFVLCYPLLKYDIWKGKNQSYAVLLLTMQMIICILFK